MSGMPSIRTSTLERDEAVKHLQTAYTDGRLNSEEFEERMSRALTSKTQEELVQLLDDLSPQPAVPAVFAENMLAKKTAYSLAILSGIERRGHWSVPENYTIVAMMGGCSLDLRTAQLSAKITTINIYAVMGGVEIIVPPGIRVEIHGLPLLGGWSNKVIDQHLPLDAPVLRIQGVAFMGGVEVRSKKPQIST